jgi:predicted outer membrane repeat protein
MKSLTVILTMLWIVLGIAVASAQVVYYVDCSTSTPGSGTDWDEPFDNLQDALDAAAAVSDPVEIWVAKGRYYPSEPIDPSDDRTATFLITRNYLAIYGGFKSGDSFADRAPMKNRTFLSGDIGTPGDRSDNCYRVVTMITVNQTAILDGFIVQKGVADDAAGVMVTGGGMHIEGGGPTIRKCALYDNTARYGAGIYIYESAPTVTYCIFLKNDAYPSSGYGSGGGLYCYNSVLELDKCRFKDNEAHNGGGVCGDASNLVVTECVFEKNTAYIQGAGLNTWASTSLWLANSDFSNNAAVSYGGGVYAGGDEVTIRSCSFEHNSAGYRGGGLYCASLELTNCKFFSNTAWTGYGLGGGIYCYSASGDVSINNCSLADNVAGDLGGGLFYDDSGYPSYTPTVVNSIFRMNETYAGYDQIYDDAGVLDVSYSCIQGGWPGTHIITVPPHFVDRSSGNLRLDDDSPCIDEGNDSGVPPDVTEDLDGNDRFNGTVDMGAYEHY